MAPEAWFAIACAIVVSLVSIAVLCFLILKRCLSRKHDRQPLLSISTVQGSLSDNVPPRDYYVVRPSRDCLSNDLCDVIDVKESAV